MKLINQPVNSQLGNELVKLIQTNKYNEIYIVVAFAKNSGVLRLKDYFDKFRANGGKITVYVGIDLYGTSYEALTNLFNCTDQLKIIHYEGTQTFHPKIYFFKGDEISTIIVGSNNLTSGGLWSNFESCIYQDILNPDTSQSCKDFYDYINFLNSDKCSSILVDSQNTIDELYKDHYITKEITEILKKLQEKTKKEHNSDNIKTSKFKVIFKSLIPSLFKDKKEKSKKAILPEIDSNEIKTEITFSNNNLSNFWIESKAMTGGSRNILDLSKKSLISKGNISGSILEIKGESKFIHGAVEFFELDPMAVNVKKDITLNFLGTDYIGNTILYPTGNNANGTWRLQIKGVDKDKNEITKVFGKIEDKYLVEKILVFSKISSDYYYLSVYSSKEISNFENTSKILAYNGSVKTAKKLGYF